MKAKLLLTGCIVLLFAVAAIASPSLADNTIHACAQMTVGSLRMVSADTICHPDEVPVSWNIIGPQGPVGPQGPRGVANGISVAAHGHISGYGINPTLISGLHLSGVIRNGQVGEYAMGFSTTFTDVPDCTVTLTTYESSPPANPPTNPGTCYINDFYTSQRAVFVNCTDSNGDLADREFHLLCVQ